MILKVSDLIEELNNYINSHIQFAENLQQLPEKQLQFRVSNTSWSVLECLEHLNLYGAFYNQKIRQSITKSSHKKSTTFKTGYFGNRFALSMLPKQSMKTMNTFKSKNPIYTSLNKEKVLNEFLQQQYQLLELLELSKNKNLTKIYTQTTLPLLKFRLGDTFRFVIYHNERHIVQAKKVLKNK